MRYSEKRNRYIDFERQRCDIPPGTRLSNAAEWRAVIATRNGRQSDGRGYAPSDVEGLNENTRRGFR